MFGIYWATTKNVWVLGYSACLCLLFALTHERKRVDLSLLFIIGLGLVGAFRATHEELAWHKNAQTLTHASIAVEGIVTSQSTANGTHKLDICLTRAHAYANKKLLGLERSATIRVTTQKNLPQAVGMLIKIPKLYVRLPSNNQHQRMLRKGDIVATGILGKDEALYIEATTPTYFQKWLQWRDTLRNNLHEKLTQELSPQAAQLVSTIFLGYPIPSQDASMRTTFNVWGISHYLARSGLHVMIIIYMVHLFFMMLPIGFVIRFVSIALLCLIYSIFSWPTVSFTRAILMFLWYGICTIHNTTPHSLHIIGGVSLITLLYQPLYLLSADFQLSFGLTAVIAIIRFITTVVSRSARIIP